MTSKYDEVIEEMREALINLGAIEPVSIGVGPLMHEINDTTNKLLIEDLLFDPFAYKRAPQKTLFSKYFEYDEDDMKIWVNTEVAAVSLENASATFGLSRTKRSAPPKLAARKASPKRAKAKAGKKASSKKAATGKKTTTSKVVVSKVAKGKKATKKVAAKKSTKKKAAKSVTKKVSKSRKKKS